MTPSSSSSSCILPRFPVMSLDSFQRIPLKHSMRIVKVDRFSYILLPISYKIPMPAVKARHETDVSFAEPHFVWHATILDASHVLYACAGKFTARPMSGLKVYRLSDFSSTGIQDYPEICGFSSIRPCTVVSRTELRYQWSSLCRLCELIVRSQLEGYHTAQETMLLKPRELLQEHDSEPIGSPSYR
jgi:hypothetical protein